MFQTLAYLLDLIMRPCYSLTGNWWMTILLFTLITKVILLPLSLWCQKNSIVMVCLMPELNRIKTKYYGDRETIGDEQNELYKKRHYHPLLSLIPLVVQIFILFGLVDVIHSITDGGAPGTAFLGLIPATDGGLSWIMPIAAGLSAVIMGFAQNRINPLQKEQSTAEKNVTNGLSIALSLCLGVFVAAGMAFYWVCSNLSSIAIQALCNVIIKPGRYIDYQDLEESRKPLRELEALGGSKRKWYQRDPLSKRERADYRRFFNIVDKHLVFFSEGSGFYKYFQGAISWLLGNSDITIHYITNDPDDQIFGIAADHPRIQPYYIGPKRIITLMMKMDADMVVTTLGDLDTYYIKRSYVRKDIEYVYMFHHMTSAILTSHREEYENYDTLLCVGQHQIDDIRAVEKYYGTPAKNLVPCGYDLLDSETAAYDAIVKSGEHNERPVILIAPSWQDGCIPDSCIDPMLKALLGHGWRIVVRPHPEYTKRYRARWDAILARWAEVPDEDLHFERDFSSNTTIFTSDILITDWSSVAYEFSFSTRKPCIFIDTPMKVGNPDYLKIGVPQIDITLRNEVGTSLAPAAIENDLASTVSSMLARPDAWKSRISDIVAKTVFNLGHGGQAAGEYILKDLLEKQEARKAGSPSAAPAEPASTSETPASGTPVSAEAVPAEAAAAGTATAGVAAAEPDLDEGGATLDK